MKDLHRFKNFEYFETVNKSDYFWRFYTFFAGIVLKSPSENCSVNINLTTPKPQDFLFLKYPNFKKSGLDKFFVVNNPKLIFSEAPVNRGHLKTVFSTG